MNITEILLYFASFIILFLAEIFSTLHVVYLTRNKKLMVALCGGISSALWCIKIVIVVSQPLAILTGFLGAFSGTLVAFKISQKNHL